jgi:lipocalin-like protein
MNALGHRILLLAAALGVVAPAHAADLSVVGTWKLLSFVREDVVSGKTTRPWGENPSGYLMYLPDGHMSAVLTSESRKDAAPPTDEKQTAQLFLTMSAYAGTYTVQGNTVVHHVDVAWQPSWVGSDQPRQATLEGDTLTIRTQPIRYWVEGKDYVIILVWKRAK